jgi:hypothetical protein
MQFSEIGRCTAASTIRSSAEAFCANAAAKVLGPTLPTTVSFFFSELAISVKGLTCFEICIFGWCVACCTRTDIDADWFCGRLTIDTTSGPYPE